MTLDVTEALSGKTKFGRGTAPVGGNDMPPSLPVTSEVRGPATKSQCPLFHMAEIAVIPSTDVHSRDLPRI